ncbi:MAG: DUF6132 family protein [Bacteroidales bacterium]|nr:DUF6132 family protein [Bacteroidales bacterium]MDZ4204634.1 DUF6132 family protein [Bacteroidales bacterium]
MKILKKYLIPIIGTTLGVIIGYLYYRYVGCRAGGCAITSNPYMSILWGAAIGYLLSDSVAGFLKPKPKKEEKQSD